jgi:hypothetical protein
LLQRALCCRAPQDVETAKVIAQEPPSSALGPSSSIATGEVPPGIAAYEYVEVKASAYWVFHFLDKIKTVDEQDSQRHS